MRRRKCDVIVSAFAFDGSDLESTLLIAEIYYEYPPREAARLKLIEARLPNIVP
jgi:hypothetical protein